MRPIWHGVPNEIACAKPALDQRHDHRARGKEVAFAFMPRVRVMRDGVTYHATKTFDRRPAAASSNQKRKRDRDATTA